VGSVRTTLISRIALAALALLPVHPVAGQTVATSFEELRFKVKAGDTVYVTDDTGQSEQEARVLDLRGSILVLSINDARREVVEGNVARIRRRVPDSRKNGTLIGFLVGAAGSTTGAIAMASPSGSCAGACVAVNVLYGGGVGAVVGLGIDALVQGRQDIYAKARNQASGAVSVRPFFVPAAKGLNLSFVF
jgi:hypothetical protein